ncbi:hypothetical protein phiHau3_67 [Streptomyces phage phiHau3]|uniref:Uncharacterized protein n=1 Tax=Streptomyces phage phiHau3 TaxID=1204524 RepID=K4I2J8_9CAUD|nr:hypothetical protein phiHau3_67 [Streptomyces phage phiHau3]AFU62045.1 hypothetical protein phiHau3_67 [Streptomyces phage phiHau3]
MIAAVLSTAFSTVKTLTPKTTVVIALGAGLVLGAATPISEPAPVAQSFTLADPQISYVGASWVPPKLPTRACSLDNQVTRSCYYDAAKRGNGKGYSYTRDAHGKVTYLNPKLNNQAARAKWDAGKQAAGWEDWGTVDGHALCWAKVGDTSRVACFDGYRTTS